MVIDAKIILKNTLFMDDALEREGILYGDVAYFMFCTYRVFYYKCALRSEPRWHD